MIGDTTTQGLELPSGYLYSYSQDNFLKLNLPRNLRKI